MNFKTLSWNSSVNAIIFLLLGILLLFFPIESMTIAGYLIASFLCFMGCGHLIRLYNDRKNLTNGDIIYMIISFASIALSISIFIDPTWIIRMLNLLVGLLLIISTIINLKNLLKFKKSRNNSWWSFVVLSLLILILGILVIINPLWLASILTRLEGISLIFDTIITILLTRKLKKVLLLEEKTSN